MPAGCATGASHEVDIEQAGRFAIEVAKAFSNQAVSFYDEDEYKRLLSLYGPMNLFQTDPGRVKE